MKFINKLDESAILHLSSSHAILSLENIIKELLENSIDAQATFINIKLQNYGLNCIEVQDNGIGMSETNLKNFVKRHHTSKMERFSDIENVNTFGFRGEALSSITALSECLTVITNNNQNDNKAVKIVYKLGSQHDKFIVARERGTTILVKNIFNSLPVRRKELQRNIKREFTKTVALLQTYALIPLRIRIKCFNTITNDFNLSTNSYDKEQQILSVDGTKNDIKQNILNVFGLKAFENLMQLSIPITNKLSLDEESSTKNNIKVEGYISSCKHGCGRTSADRQFFYINNRPVLLNPVKKLINELYRSYNKTQYPFICLFINVASGSYDINVTPDKGVIYLQNMDALLEITNTHLKQLYDNKLGELDSIALSSRSFNPNSKSLPDNTQQTTLENFNFNIETTIPPIYKRKEPHLSPNEFDIAQISQSDFPNKHEKTIETSNDNNLDLTGKFLSSSYTFSKASQPQDLISINGNFANDYKTNINNNSINVINKDDENVVSNSDSNNVSRSNNIKTSPAEKLFIQLSQHSQVDSRKEGSAKDLTQNTKIDTYKLSEISSVFNTPPTPNVDQHKCIEIKNGIENMEYAETPNLSEGKTAKRLKPSISKSAFGEMEIIGQFNMGFIITKLGNEFFIVDQHASDEKFNYEAYRQRYSLLPSNINKKSHLGPSSCQNDHQLQEISMQCQNHTDSQPDSIISHKLIKPIPLKSFTMEDQVWLQEHIDVFKALGFDFKFESETPYKNNEKGHGDDFLHCENEEQIRNEDFLDVNSEANTQINRFYMTASRGFMLDNSLTLLDEKDLLEILYKLKHDPLIFNTSVVLDDYLPTKDDTKVKIVDPLLTSDPFPPLNIEKEVMPNILDNKPCNDCSSGQTITATISQKLTNFIPSKIERILASKACRTSIMIGTALKPAQMQRVVRRLAHLNNPWACPHGRPTINHLYTLKGSRSL